VSKDNDFPGPHEADASEEAKQQPQLDSSREAGSGEPSGPPLPEDVLQRWAELSAEESQDEEVAAKQAPGKVRCPVASGWTPLGILLLTLVLLGAVTYKLYHDLAAANQALTAAVNTMAAASGPSGPAEAQKVAGHISQGNYDQVVRALQEMAGRVASRAAAAPVAPPGALPNVPPNLAQELGPEASRFFNDRPRLLRQLLALAAGARALEAKGINVDVLRPIRDRAIKAAAAGDEAAVEKLAGEFEAKLRALGGSPEPIPPLPGERQRQTGKFSEELVAKARRLEATLKSAAREGKDISRAVRLAKRAEQAADAGDMQQAENLLDAAMRAAERAPRMAGPRLARRPRAGAGYAARRPGTGPATALDAILAMLRAEESDLAATYEAVENAEVALREANQQQILQMLEEAQQTLRRIARRRNEVSLALEGGRRPRGRKATRPGPTETSPAATAAKLPLPERLIAFLEDVRKMPEAQFEASKRELAGIVFAMFLPPPPERGAPKANAEEIERVKEKLRLAAGPYMQRKLAGEDMTELDALLSQARAAIYRGDVEVADHLIDQALQQLGLLPASPAGQGAEGASSAEEPPAGE